MAKLPTYDRQVIKTDIGPAVGTQNLEGNVRQSQALQKLFDQATAWAGEEAIKYSVEKATQDFLDQPLTVRDYEQAMRRGEDPIARFKRGGVSYNDTIKKLHGHQARMELGSQTQALQEDVLARVKRGELTDPNQIKKELESSIRGYGKAVSAIDVEQGMNYISTARTHSKYYYKAAMKELGDQAELKMQLTVNGIIDQSARSYETFLDTEFDPEKIYRHRQMLLADAQDTFKLTGKVTENLNKFNEKMDKILFAKLGDKIAKENFDDGVTKDALMQDMQSGNEFGMYTNFYRSLTADDRNKLDTAVSTAMTNLEIQKSSSSSVATSLLSMAKTEQNNGTIIDLKEVDKYPLTEKQSMDYNLIVTKNGILKSLQDSTTQSREAVIAQINKEYAGEENSIIRADLNSFIKTQIARIDDQVQNNTIEYMSEHKGFKEHMDVLKIDINRMGDSNYIKEMETKFEKRRGALQALGIYEGKTDFKFFSKSEIDYYEGQFQNISAAEGLSDDEKINRQIGLATTLTKVFKGDTYKLFQEFEKDNAYAHVGNLVVNAYDSKTPDINAIKHLVRGAMIDKGFFGDKQRYDLPTKEIDTYNAQFFAEAYGNGDNKTIVENATLKIYKSLNVLRPDRFDSKLYKKAAEIAVGQNGEYGGFVNYKDKQMVIPGSIKREDFKLGLLNLASLEDIESVMQDAKGNAVQNLGPGNKPYSLDQLRRASIDFKDGHRVTLSNIKTRFLADDQELYFADEKGNPIYINMTELYQLILTKNPNMKVVGEKPISLGGGGGF